MSADSVLIEIGASVQYQIIDVEKAHFACQNLDHQLRAAARSVVGKYLSQLTEKEMCDSRTNNAHLKVCSTVAAVFSVYIIIICVCPSHRYRPSISIA